MRYFFSPHSMISPGAFHTLKTPDTNSKKKVIGV